MKQFNPIALFYFLEVYPSIKMKFENYGSPILGDKLEAMHITWRD
jgi:hypothetical protein